MSKSGEQVAVSIAAADATVLKELFKARATTEAPLRFTTARAVYMEQSDGNMSVAASAAPGGVGAWYAAKVRSKQPQGSWDLMRCIAERVTGNIIIPNWTSIAYPYQRLGYIPSHK